MNHYINLSFCYKWKYFCILRTYYKRYYQVIINAISTHQVLWVDFIWKKASFTKGYGIVSNVMSGFTEPHMTIIVCCFHYCDVIMSTIASQITSLAIVYSTIYSGADQWKHPSSASPAFVRGIHRWPVNSPRKWPVTRKMFPFDDVIMSFFTGQVEMVAVRILPEISSHQRRWSHCWMLGIMIAGERGSKVSLEL